jgi:hypothetical protein
MLVVHPWITLVAAGRPATTPPGLMRSNCVDQQMVESWQASTGLPLGRPPL